MAFRCDRDQFSPRPADGRSIGDAKHADIARRQESNRFDVAHRDLAITWILERHVGRDEPPLSRRRTAYGDHTVGIRLNRGERPDARRAKRLGFYNVASFANVEQRRLKGHRATLHCAGDHKLTPLQWRHRSRVSIFFVGKHDWSWPNDFGDIRSYSG